MPTVFEDVLEEMGYFPETAIPDSITSYRELKGYILEELGKHWNEAKRNVLIKRRYKYCYLCEQRLCIECYKCPDCDNGHDKTCLSLENDKGCHQGHQEREER